MFGIQVTGYIAKGAYELHGWCLGYAAVTCIPNIQASLFGRLINLTPRVT